MRPGTERDDEGGGVLFWDDEARVVAPPSEFLAEVERDVLGCRLFTVMLRLTSPAARIEPDTTTPAIGCGWTVRRADEVVASETVLHEDVDEARDEIVPISLGGAGSRSLA